MGLLSMSQWHKNNIPVPEERMLQLLGCMGCAPKGFPGRRVAARHDPLIKGTVVRHVNRPAAPLDEPELVVVQWDDQPGDGPGEKTKHSQTQMRSDQLILLRGQGHEKA